MLRKFRIFSNWLSGYNFGDPKWNGEYYFLRHYLRNGMTIFDVGANVGEYTDFALSIAPHIEVHCFEPVHETFKRLHSRYSQDSQIHLNYCGLSNETGSAHMKIYGDAYGTNSLYERRSAVAIQPAFASFVQQEITLTSLERYVKDKAISRIDLLKIDVEGHELKVLQGADKELAAGNIRCIQFEYGGSFIDSQTSLREIYELLTSYKYKIYRLLPFGKWRIRSFDPVWGLENYQHSNWIAMRQ